MMRNIWTTAGGYKIPIIKMTDSHLINTIKYLRRTVDRRKANVAAQVADAFDDVFTGMEILEMDDEEFLSIHVDQYDFLIEELNNRGLKL